jgi:hypothetical protein
MYPIGHYSTKEGIHFDGDVSEPDAFDINTYLVGFTAPAGDGGGK